MAAPDLVKNRHWPQARRAFGKGTTSLSQTVASGSGVVGASTFWLSVEVWGEASARNRGRHR
jgi:hypothetical protein